MSGFTSLSIQMKDTRNIEGNLCCHVDSAVTPTRCSQANYVKWRRFLGCAFWCMLHLDTVLSKMPFWTCRTIFATYQPECFKYSWYSISLTFHCGNWPHKHLEKWNSLLTNQSKRKDKDSIFSPLFKTCQSVVFTASCNRTTLLICTNAPFWKHGVFITFVNLSLVKVGSNVFFDQIKKKSWNK